MELNEMEKKLLFQVEGDYQTKILNELYMTVRYSNNSEQREAAEGLMAKLRVLSNAECMDLVKDIQKNYRLPYPARTIGEKIAEARQQSGAEKLKGHDLLTGKKEMTLKDYERITYLVSSLGYSQYLQFLIGKYMDLAQADEEREEREHEIYLEYPEYYEDEGILEEEKWLEEFLNQLPEKKREYFEKLIKES